MIVAFETERTKILDDFLDSYENPKSVMGVISKFSFLEFKVYRLDDLIIISQKHLYDVVAKWLILCAFATLLLEYVFGNRLFFFLSFLFLTVGILWLSKWIRFHALRINLRRRGHRLKMRLLSNDEVIDKLLLRNTNESK